MQTLTTSQAVFTGTLREVHECGEAPELDHLINVDNQRRERYWFPEVVEMIGKKYFRVQELAKKVYACEDQFGSLNYVETGSMGAITPSVKCLPIKQERDRLDRELQVKVESS